MKGHGMHWICSGGLRTLEIAVERSRMSRTRCIAVDKPPDMLEVCEKIGEAPEGTKYPKNCEVKRSAGERRLLPLDRLRTCTELRNRVEAMTAEKTMNTVKPIEQQKDT